MLKKKTVTTDNDVVIYKITGLSLIPNKEMEIEMTSFEKDDIIKTIFEDYPEDDYVINIIAIFMVDSINYFIDERFCQLLKSTHDTSASKHKPMHNAPFIGLGKDPLSDTSNKDRSVFTMTMPEYEENDDVPEDINVVNNEESASLENNESITESDKKYVFTGEFKMCQKTDAILHRIKAIKNIPGIVNIGESGGWIESESNLSQDGNCWISIDSTISGDVRIMDDVYVQNSSTIHGKNIEISGETVLSGRNVINGKNIQIKGSSVICDTLMVGSNLEIIDTKIRDSKIHTTGIITGESKISVNNATIYNMQMSEGESKESNVVVMRRKLSPNSSF